MSAPVWPTINASLNATSALLLLAGLGSIRVKQIAAHVLCMLGAVLASSLFLISYLVYHARVGSVRFHGAGSWRALYFIVLISHTVLALVVVPLAGRTLWLAGRKRFAQHVALARWAFPLWLYVSVTGVVVYWMLYRMP